MCGRFTLTRDDFDDLAEELGATVRPEHRALYRPRYNIAPTDQHWIVRTKQEQRELLPAAWGLVNASAPDRKRAASQINARSESAPTSRAFRDAFENRRCAIPADGFFEWQGAKEARKPVWFHAPDGGLLLFAGLHESWRDPASGAWTRTFTILTTGANSIVEPVHDRMPVVLARDTLDDWLHVPADEAQREQYAREAAALLAPAPDAALIATEVSRLVNSVKNDDPACLAPAHDGEPSAQGTLL